MPKKALKTAEGSVHTIDVDWKYGVQWDNMAAAQGATVINLDDDCYTLADGVTYQATMPTGSDYTARWIEGAAGKVKQDPAPKEAARKATLIAAYRHKASLETMQADPAITDDLTAEIAAQQAIIDANQPA